MILKLIIHSEKRFCKIHFNQHKGNNSMCDKRVQSLGYVWLNFIKTSSHSKAPLLQCTHVSILLQQSWRGFNNMHVYLSDRKRGRNYLIIFCIIFFKKWTCMNKIWVKMGSVLAGGRLICVLWILCRISRAIFSCQPSTNELKARWLHPQRQHAGYCTAFRLNSIFFFFQTFWFFKCAFFHSFIGILFSSFSSIYDHISNHLVLFLTLSLVWYRFISSFFFQNAQF